MAIERSGTRQGAGKIGIRPWYAVPPAEALRALGSGEDGLDPADARARLAADGPNVLRTSPPRSRLAQLLDQLRSPLIAILLVAAAIAWWMGKGLDVYVILAVVALNTALGYVLERRAAGAIAALRKLTSPRARVLRGGEIEDVPAAEVVVGDVLVLEPGDRVAADARLVHASELAIGEAELTGESVPATKAAAAIAGAPGLPLGDQANMAFMNTAVVAGRGRAVVTATGMATEMGRIAADVAEAGSVTPIQRKIAAYGRSLGLAILVIVGAIMALGVALGRPPGETIYMGVSLAVAAIPEGLPIVVSVLFAVGVTRMARRCALVRRLPAVEGLGSATVICTDKTGTLTRNAMTVEHVVVGDRRLAVEGAGYAPEGRVLEAGRAVTAADLPALRWVAACARLCNDAVVERAEGAWRVIGDPTEGALVVLAAKLGDHAAWERVQEIPFSSERKWMATLHRAPDGELVAFVKGALGSLLPLASHHLTAEGEVRPFDAAARDRLVAAADDLAGRALRTLALGMVRHVDHPEALSGDFLAGRLVLAGLVGMIDPPRPEATAAVARCRAAGIRVAMITGDHRVTAMAIARDLGILGGAGRVLAGADLDALDDAALERAVAETAVYARVSPAHKLRIVRALQRRGEIVAMTGDGVNDAPALAQADVGIAMGITGTEVAKGAAAIVLADDDFATIVAAVEEGRTIAQNLRNVAGYLTATCVGNIATIAGALVLALPLPLTAVMLLWINLVATGVFDKPLALERGDPGLMARPPRSPAEALVGRAAFGRVLAMGGLMAVGTLAAFAWELGHGTPLAQAQTEAFTVNATFQAFSAFAYRSSDRPIWRLPPNPWLLGAAVLALGFHLLAVYAPPFQAFLGTVPLTAAEFALAVAEGAGLLALAEAYKAWRGRA
jgi:magnesium-transporting ATPase (P-type)